MSRLLIGLLAAVALLAAAAPGPAQTQPPTTPPAPPQGTLTGRRSPPQPTQQQGIEYFRGSWAFKWTGRESALTPGPRSGTAQFEQAGAAPRLDLRVEAQIDGGPAYKQAGVFEWHADTKMMQIRESYPGAGEVASTGDWSSPIAMRVESAPVTVKGETLKLKRTFNIISATSFTVDEELSINGGPFVRLGRGVFTRK